MMSSYICQACPEGDLRRLQELVKRSLSRMQETNKNGRILLHEAHKNFNIDAHQHEDQDQTIIKTSRQPTS
jgi:hypothetical protein